jgi:hypothetical protein
VATRLSRQLHGSLFTLSLAPLTTVEPQFGIYAARLVAPYPGRAGWAVLV